MSAISRMIAVVVGSAVLLVGSAASATVYWVSFSGTMASGTDSGLFGAPGSLAGKSFVATYTYDTDNFWYRDKVPGVFDSISPAPVALTIDGSTYVFPKTGILNNSAMAEPGELNFSFFSAVDADPVDLEYVQNSAFSPWFQPNLDFGGAAIISAPGGGEFYIHVCCCPHCGPNFSEIQSSGTFNTDTVKVAIPEPATWALMLGGFGLAGAVLRRHRAAAA